MSAEPALAPEGEFSEDAETQVQAATLVLKLRGLGIADRNVLRAIETVPRMLFVPPDFRHRAYADHALPIDCGQTMEAPSLVATITEALDLSDRHAVLEVGTGSGYHTAVLARLARRVTTIERFRTLAKAVLRLAAPAELERLDALEPAVRSGMIEELPSPTLAYRFTHELVRRALYDRLSVVRRAELHLRIGEALEATGRPARGRMLADLAHHFAAAAPIDGPRRAIDYNLLAADAASAALAHGEAAARLRTALRIGVDDEHRRAEILLALGLHALSRGPHRRGARGVRPGGGDRAAARRRGAARARGDRVREDLLAARPHRPGGARAARRGVGGLRPRGLDAAGGRARRARARARVPERPAGGAGGARARASRWPGESMTAAASRAC